MRTEDVALKSEPAEVTQGAGLLHRLDARIEKQGFGLQWVHRQQAFIGGEAQTFRREP